LLGSPPGYVGGEIKPLLCQENLDRHHKKAMDEGLGLFQDGIGRFGRSDDEGHLSLILFDEIEKAHPKLWNMLLGILEDGTLVLGNNEEVDFRRSIIVLTTNVGSKAMGKHLSHESIGFAGDESDEQMDHDLHEAALKEARKIFPFEFLNRFDDIVTFHTLKDAHLYEILDILLTQIHHRSLRCSEPFLLEVTPKAKAWLVEEGTDRQYGARPLKRLVEKELVTRISHLICSDQIRKGDLITVDIEKGDLTFQKETGGADWDELEALGPFGQEKWAGSDLGVKDDGGEKEQVKEEVANVLAATGVFHD
jgi:ATP-dependent Clp protease ATP-binding subunit ClpA